MTYLSFTENNLKDNDNNDFPKKKTWKIMKWKKKKGFPYPFVMLCKSVIQIDPYGSDHIQKEIKKKRDFEWKGEEKHITLAKQADSSSCGREYTRRGSKSIN